MTGYSKPLRTPAVADQLRALNRLSQVIMKSYISFFIKEDVLMNNFKVVVYTQPG